MHYWQAGRQADMQDKTGRIRLAVDESELGKREGGEKDGQGVRGAASWLHLPGRLDIIALCLSTVVYHVLPFQQESPFPVLHHPD